jgi:V8-like Glu-specific endopeptidase
VKRPLCLLAFALACQPVFAQSLRIFPLNIFKNDSLMRKPASSDEILWTVTMGGCTASMLSPKYLLTANHCTPRVGDTYTSGACLALSCRNDLKVVRVTERYANFDTALVEVSWNRTDSRTKQRYTPKVQTRDSELTYGRDGQASELFTVGFPGDKSGTAMHAVGYAKSAAGNSLNYNVPSINGNSGGAVWKRDDFTLVSQTNSGPQALGQPGWNNRDPEDSTAWNNGPRMHLVYAASPLLKTLFPNGENWNVSLEGYLIWDDSF